MMDLEGQSLAYGEGERGVGVYPGEVGLASNKLSLGGVGLT